MKEKVICPECGLKVCELVINYDMCLECCFDKYGHCGSPECEICE